MILDRYLLKQFFPVFCVAVSMFMLLLSMIDLFANLVRYLNYEVSTLNIFKVSFYYLPKSLSYALPISLLFAAAYSLGDLYSRNELTSVFASGIPFYRFSAPLVVVGLVSSLFAFVFDDAVVIPTLRLKNNLSRALLHEARQDEKSNIVIKARSGNLIYAVDFFDTNLNTLNGVSIIEQDDEGHMIYLIRAQQADWVDEYWNFSNPVMYHWEDGFLRYKKMEYTEEYRENPDTFRRNMVDVEELQVKDARLLVQDLRISGLPVVKALSSYHHRYSFASVPLVVIFLSLSMAGRFKKNVLLMSLLSSLVTAVVFYVMEMLSMMLARSGYIHPFIGAWFPVLVFIAIGTFLLRTAKT